MLTSLEIRDLIIIDHLALNPGAGLNALTGETGAGKSILLDALGFVLGWRGRADLVRTGAEEGEVTAVFEPGPGHRAWEVMEEAGIPAGAEGEIILRRVSREGGRKSAWVNGRRVSGEVLRALSDCLVELHGQGDESGLLNPRRHRALLDAFAGHGPRLERLREAWRGLGAEKARLAEAEESLAAAREEEDFLRHAAAELAELAPEPGEEATLDTSRRLMQAAGKVEDDIARAVALLGPGEGAEGQMGAAMRWLEGVASETEGALDGAIAALERALVELGEASHEVAQAQEAMRFEPQVLEACEERLFAIRALARKHGVAPDDLPALSETLNARLAALDSGAGDVAALREAVAAAQAAYDAEAGALHAARLAAAQRLDAAMARELPPLKLERARFTTEITPGTPGPEGADNVTFTAATNPGSPSGPLGKVASGGELSRFLLALKVCLTADDSGLTLIFDEIDRGVGGATADAVGKRLAQLGQGGQVLVVTHAPQVAARARHQWHVSKHVENGSTLSRVTVLDAAGRVDEIARMLAGDTVTEAARDAARALLEGGAQGAGG